MPQKYKPSISIYCGISTQKTCCKSVLDNIKNIYDNVTEPITFDKGKAIVDWKLIDSIELKDQTDPNELYNRIILYLEQELNIPIPKQYETQTPPPFYNPFYSGIDIDTKCCQSIIDEFKKIYNDVKEPIIFNKGEATVKWKLIDSIDTQKYSGSKLYTQIILHLKDLDILSSEKDKTFSLDSGGINLNPKINSFPQYFTREEDAIAYKDIVYKNAKYQIDII
ncbi:MAG: hypothetical protein K0B07_00135 [DPANN group archaeon]|nr:hypothetical protein [DPANN group archaeon]